MMKMNRKALALLASVMLAASTAGCGNPADNNGSTLEAMASVPETGAGEEPSDITAQPSGETAEPEEKAGTATAGPAVTEMAASVAKTVPAAISTAEPTASAEPKTAAASAEPASGSSGGGVVFTDNAPAVAGVVEKTETVSVPAQSSGHQRPEGMPEVAYSEEEMLTAMMLYGGLGDGYKDNGDGTWTYYNSYESDASNTATTTTVTTDNWYRGSEEDILAKIAELQAMYPDGSYWGDDSYYDNPGSTLDNYMGNNNACAGFAKLVSDYLFGCDAPVRSVSKHYSEFRPGDIIRTSSDHVVVFTGATGSAYVELDTESTIDGEYVNMLRFNFMDGNAVSPDGYAHVRCRVSDYEIVPQYGHDEYFKVLTRWPEN